MIIFLEKQLDVRFLYFFLIVYNKPHANPTIIYENIKEIHILTVGGIPGILYFKSCASPPCTYLVDTLLIIGKIIKP